MTRMHAALVALFATSLLPALAAANPGALEINQDCVAVGCFAGDAPGFPVTISQPGTYLLTSDLAPPGDSSTNSIEVGVSGVDLDLNGHTVDGGATCSGNPVTTCANFGGSRGIVLQSPLNAAIVAHVHNGSVRGFSNGGLVVFAASDGTLIDHLTLTENSFGMLLVGSSANATTRIRDSQFVRNLFDGATVANNGARLLVENSSFTGNSQDGLALSTGSVAVGNRFNDNGALGLQCGGSTCALGQNTFMGNNGGGAAAQFNVGTLRDMGGNVCMDDGTCP